MECGGGGRGAQSRRSEKENSLFRPLCSLLQLPPCTFHLSACKIEPLSVLHIYCDPITLPHIQPSDESCCSGSAILKRKKKKKTCYDLPPLYTYTHTHTSTHHLHKRTRTVKSHVLIFLYFVPGLVVHARWDSRYKRVSLLFCFLFLRVQAICSELYATFNLKGCRQREKIKREREW